MSKNIHISIADIVHDKIEQVMKALGKTNKSEFCEELLRIGLEKYFKKE